jgi:rod shape-determining protein MreD
MKAIIWHKVDRKVKETIPFVFTFVLVVLSVIPINIPGYKEIAPVLPMISIYHWAIYRPTLLPPWAVFILGALYDILSGVPFGLYTLVFLSVYGVVLWQRRFIIGKSFLIYWLGYGAVSLGAAFESWLIASIWYFALLNFQSILFQFLISFGVFPVVAWISLRLQQAFIGQDPNAS